ncbi:hypothetical protein PG984_003016 [Apiospora sp. TS-2023a]
MPAFSELPEARVHLEILYLRTKAFSDSLRRTGISVPWTRVHHESYAVGDDKVGACATAAPCDETDHDC